MNDEKRINELIAEAIQAIGSDEYTEFNGNDECEDCRGWDGVSYRCECGNRRVYWEYDRDSDTVIATAD